jgi:hypothetical protein
METVFSVRSVPRLYNGNLWWDWELSRLPQPSECEIWSWVPGDLEPRITVFGRASSNLAVMSVRSSQLWDSNWLATMSAWKQGSRRAITCLVAKRGQYIFRIEQLDENKNYIFFSGNTSAIWISIYIFVDCPLKKLWKREVFVTFQIIFIIFFYIIIQ